MKRFVLFAGVGILAFTFISSTCSSANGADRSDVTDKVNMAKQESGITFLDMSFEEALAESKKSGKLIFIDAYTEWCGPCKYMAKTSFMDPEVGKLFNENFINLKIEMEKDAEGPEVARRYRVVAYPTLLVVDGNGKLVKEITGVRDRNQLIAFGKSLL